MGTGFARSHFHLPDRLSDFAISVISYGVNKSLDFFRPTQELTGAITAVDINAIGKEHDCLASFDLGKQALENGV